MQVGRGVAVVVREGEAGGEAQACGFEPGKELLGAGDAAEGGYRAGNGGDFHSPANPPDGALPTTGFQLRFNLRIAGGNCDDCGTAQSFERFTQTAGRQQTVLPILAIQKQNVDVAI